MKKSIMKLLALAFLVSFIQACNEPYDPGIEPLQLDQPPGMEIAIEKVQSVVDLQDKVTDALFRNPEVAGTATGVDENGNPAIVVYTLSQVEHRADLTIEDVGRGAYPAALPQKIENIPVISRVTGMFKALADPKTKFPRPVPIGVSTGHPDITAGTIGCRVKDAAGNVYALSNNHVYANVNEAVIGDNVLQPGPYDGGQDPADAIGTLHDFEPISFSETNLIDAAIAKCPPENLGFSTPVGDAYGTPGLIVIAASIGQKLQKYGRTTGWTQGEVSGINATVDVCYESRGPFKCVAMARFKDQIMITPGTFSDGGDSGSLIVTDDGDNNPVGLLFAGSSTHTIANPIGFVLERFNVDIDDGSGSGGGTVNAPPVAGFTYTTDGLTVSFTDQSTDSNGSVVSWSWDFGDGGTSSDQNPVYIYAAGGSYSVSLMVTDNEGGTDSAVKEITVVENIGSIALSATGYKIKGRQKADLTWNNATSDDVDIYRDGVVIATTENDGFYTDNIDNVGGGSYVYQVCEAGGSVCSDNVTISF